MPVSAGLLECRAGIGMVARQPTSAPYWVLVAVEVDF